jgi:type I restriction enzyme S subunit
MLLTSVGTLGSTYIVRSTDKFYFKDGNLTWFRRFNGLNSLYLKYWLDSPDGKAEIKKSTIGSSQSALTIANLKSMQIALPSIENQEKIAQTLFNYDSLIENNNRRIAILEEMAQSLYREWFVNFRFPGHENAKFIDSPLGNIPKGWGVATVGELYKTSSGGTPSRKKPEYYGEDHWWVKTRELKDGFVIGVEERISELGLKKSSAKLFPKDTVLIAMYGATIGKLGILSNKAASNQACCALLHEKDEYSPWFIYLTLFENREKLVGLRQGAAQQNISQQVIKAFALLKPGYETLTMLNEIVEPVFRSIEKLLRKNMNLKNQRNMLLPKLISGSISLGD